MSFLANILYAEVPRFNGFNQIEEFLELTDTPHYIQCKEVLFTFFTFLLLIPTKRKRSSFALMVTPETGHKDLTLPFS